MDVFCVSSFFCLYPSCWAEWVLCLISMLHSAMLLLRLRFHSLLMRRELKRVICWCMPFVCLLSFVLTINTKFCECCVWHQCLTQWCRPCFSNLVACWCKEIEKEWIVDGCLLRVFFLLSLLSKSSSVSVGFDFSASHNDIVPVFLVPFPFYTTVKRKELFID